jgi:hypothetical protein
VIVANESHQGAVHMQIATVGLDIAKNVFQVHGIDATAKAYVKRNKNDAADAEAICEAVRRPPDHAFCAGQVGRAAEPVDAA